MTAQAFAPPQFVKAAPPEPMNGDVLAAVFLPVANSSLLPDPVLTVLAKTTTDWFASTLASKIHVNAEHGRIHIVGYIGNADPLKSLKRVLFHLPDIDDLNMTITMETFTNPLRTYPAAQYSQHVE